MASQTTSVFSDSFLDPSIHNKKGLSCEERHRDILSDPSNLLIPRVPEAGQTVSDYVVAHNGIKLVPEYYGDFFNIMKVNKGCHEPSEERMFGAVLPFIQSGGIMLELGCYWAFYSLWFATVVKDAKNFCVEPSDEARRIGERNFALNGKTATFLPGLVGESESDFRVSQFMKTNNITFLDLLHSDIQGAEIHLIKDIGPLLDERRIGYVFISTHSDEIHYAIQKELIAHKYRIIASADFEKETFCFDGILVACPEENKELPYVSLGCRQHTPLRSTPF